MGFSGAIKNKGTRTTVILLAFAVPIVILFAYMVIKPKKQNLPAEISGASIAQAPNTMENARVEREENPVAMEMRKELNERLADEAERNGSTMIPRADHYQLPSAEEVNTPKEGVPFQTSSPPQPAYNPQAAQIQAQANQIAVQQANQLAQRKAAAYEGLLARWDPSATSVVSLTKDVQKADGSIATGAPSSNNPTTQNIVDTSPAVVFSGDIVTAKIDTFVNTDKPGPVRATILSGDLAGGYLIGSVERQVDSAKITFTTLTHPEKNISISVDAITLDAQTMATGVATEVDNHVFEKYVVRPLATGAKSLADAIVQNRQSTVASLTGIQTSSRPLTGGDQAAVVLGSMANQMVIDSRQTPLVPTAYVDPKDPGSVVGVLFLKSVTQNDLLPKRK